MSSVSILLSKGKKEGEKQRYESRKAQVTGIKNNIYNVSEGYVSNINGKIDRLNAKLGDAIKGIGAVDGLRSTVDSKKERVGADDRYLAAYQDELEKEIGDCQRKIYDLETEISSLGRQYTRELNKEKEEAKKALEALADAVKL